MVESVSVSVALIMKFYGGACRFHLLSKEKPAVTLGG
jgi:hypothetical protein